MKMLCVYIMLYVFVFAKIRRLLTFINFFLVLNLCTFW